MSDNPKDDDWAMTTPNLRLDDELQKDAPPKVETPNLPPADDWGMTAQNVNIPPNAFTTKETPALGKNDDWQMPTPVFRVSEGETPNFDKTTPNFNLKNLDENFPVEEDSGNKTAPYYHLPENQTAPQSAAPPIIAGQTDENLPPKTAVVKPKSGNAKWILLLGGLFAFFLLVTAGLVAAYFLYFDTPNNVKSETPANKTATPAPTSAPVSNTLPSSIDYKGAMVLVAAGEFSMGSDTGGDESKPAHKVTLPAFYIDKTEVTNAQYKEFCAANGKTPPTDPFWEKGYFEKRPNAPVLGISFDDAKEFAAWAGKRLPSEEEWEKAASWDTATQTKFDFPWGATFQNGKAAFGLQTPKDVGSFAAGASPSGAMDMAGNVAEWVDAYFQPYAGNTTSNPNFGETNRIVRGGHFGSKTDDFLKTTKRIYVPPTVASGEDEEKLFAAAIGFRCAVSADDARLQDSLKK